MNPKRILLLSIAVIVAILIVFRITSPASVKVKKLSIQNTDILRTVSASGYIKSPLEANLGFPVSGKITNVFKKEGDYVKQGELLAQIYNEDLYYDTESARKKKDSAQRTRDSFRETNGDHIDDYGGQKIYSINDQKYTDDLRVYDNAYKASLAVLKKTYLYAPFDGTITALPFHIGEVAGVSTTLKLSNLSILEFQAELDQADYKFVKPDQEVEIVLDAYPQEKFLGKVASVPTYVDEDTLNKTFKLKITLPNNNDKLIKGMTGDANIVVSKEKNVKAVPFDAVYSDGDRKFVWVVNSNNKLEKKFVEIGLEGDTLTSIKTELPEFVVVPDSSAKNVKEGDSVTF